MFSRCSSELHALAAAGYAAELVPGVSSALAAPLFAGMFSRMIPLLWSCICMPLRGTCQSHADVMMTI